MSGKNIDIQDGAFNFSFTEISVRKTGDPEIDAMNKRFCKGTLNFLKSCRKDLKEYIYAFAQMAGQQTDSEAYDLGIKYDYQKYKTETSIKCFMNDDMLTAAVGADNFSMPIEEAKKLGYTEGFSNLSDLPEEIKKAMAKKKVNEFFELISTRDIVKTDAGEGFVLDEKIMKECNFLEDTKKRNEMIEKVLSQKHIYRYIKALDVFDEAREVFEDGLDYYNALNAVASAFSEKFNNKAIDVRTIIFLDAYALIFPGKNGSKEEIEIDRDYFNDELDKKWYVNLREISISPYKLQDDENDVTVNIPGEFVATLKSPYCPMKEILKGVDKIGEMYATNYEMAERSGVGIEELPVEYCPHIYIDGEMQEVDNVMLLSDDFELIEIPILAERYGMPIKLTKYYWNGEK